MQSGLALYNGTVVPWSAALSIHVTDPNAYALAGAVGPDGAFDRYSRFLATGNYAFLADGSLQLQMAYDILWHEPDVQFQLLSRPTATVEFIEIVVMAVLPTVRSSWSSVKALYR